MMAVSPWAFQNGKMDKSFCWRKGENVPDADEGQKVKNVVGVT